MATWTINGNVYSDNSTPGTRNLDNDGHRENFPLLCADIATVAGQVQTNATQVATDRATATAAATTASTGATTATTQAGIATTKASEANTSAGTASAAATSASGSAGTATTAAATATTKAGEASTSATSASGSATTATTKAAEAAASALTALNAPGTAGTSSSSATIGTGSKTITTQTAKAWVLGQPVKISRTADPSGTWMAGDITAYNSGTGSLTVDVKSTAGSGSHSDWTISLTAPVGGSVSIASVSGLQDALDAKLDDSQATATGLSVLGAVNGAAVLSIAGGQAADATLTALAGVTVAANKMLYATGTDAFATTDLTSQARQLLDDTSFDAMKVTLGLEIGVNVQAYDADLTAWAGKTAPSGAAVGTTDTQTLENKTHTGVKETIYTFSAGTSFDLTSRPESIIRCPTNGAATITLPAPSGHTGRSHLIRVEYGGTHTLAWSITGGSSFLGTVPTATSVNGKKDQYTVWSDGTNWTIADAGRNL